MNRIKVRILSNPSAHKILMEMSLDELNLSVHTYNTLRRAGFQIISDICEMNENSFMKSDKHITKRMLIEVRRELNKYGLNFSDEQQDTLILNNEEQTEEYDLQAELERKFDELFGPVDDEE